MDEKEKQRASAETYTSEKRDEGQAPVAQPKHHRRRWPFVLFGVGVVLPILLFVAWTEIALHWTYSSGQRAGFIQKFSQKGWVCKTYEGEIAMVNMPGAAQERFAFTVRDDNVASQITKLMGAHVAITYAEHRGVPGTCFGDTQYFVTGVQAVP